MAAIGRDHLCTYLLLLSFMAGAVGGNSVDLTTTPGAYGKEVVEAVVGRIRSNCILSDDKLFLRRLAYVESLDGTEPKTYRPGYHGGIWQVDESMLKATLPCHVVIQEECQIIQSAFGIDWRKVTWSDLRKPLYSGLAAALYVLQRNFFNETVPGTLEEQAAFWSHFYHLGFPDSNYTQVAAVLNGGICKAKMDLAFLLDSSGSIDFTDYLRMLNFTRDLVNALDIGPDATQVGTVVYGSDTNVAFHLDDHTDKASLQLALSFLTKDDGGTFTSGALDQARNEIFSPLHGARSDAKKVAMLLTDGASNSFYRTVKAAQLLRDEGVTIFAIGVGNPNVVELHAVASEPNCTHVVLLQSFLDINSILYSMSRDTCNAPKTINFPPIVPPSNGTSIPTVHEVTITERINTSTTLKVGSAGNGTNANSTDSGKKTLVATTECGIVEIYTSYSTPKPSSAFYEQKAIATPGREAILHFQKDVQGRPLYISVVGSNLPETGVAVATDCRYNVTISKQTPVEVVCREGGQERPCTSIDLASVCKGSGLDLNTNVHNPCSHESIESGHLIHPYPLDTTFYIQCNLQGEMYITKCPNHKLYNAVEKRCGFNAGTGSPSTSGTSLKPGDVNPCTAASLLKGLYFFGYGPDPHKYIHCDVWGKAWLQDCYPGHVWNDPAHTCVPDGLHEFDTTISPALHNPCTQQALSQGRLFFPYPGDVTKYIHCDVSGNYYVQNCFIGGRFDPASNVCVRRDVG